MNNRKHLYIIIVIVFSFVLLIAGSTYAAITLMVDVTNGNITGSTGCFDVTYGGNSNLITGTLFESANYQNGLHGSVSLGIVSGCTTKGTGSLYMKVSNTSSSKLTSVSVPHCEDSTNLATLTNYSSSSSCTSSGNKWVTDGSALKYVILNGSTILKAGYITDNMVGENNILYNNISVTNTASNFNVYVWLDGNLTDNEYVNLSFSGNINALVVQNED